MRLAILSALLLAPAACAPVAAPSPAALRSPALVANELLAADRVFATSGLARYDPQTNAVTVLPVAFGGGFLRASTREASSGWMYLATARPNRLYRFRPPTGVLEDLGDLPGYTAHIVLDPSERYVY